MVRVVSSALTPFSPLLSWYDRAPIDRSLSWSAAGLAPHAATVRATYTVPTGKKAFVGSANAQMRRVTVATTLGRATIYVTWVGATEFTRLHLNNTVDSVDQDNAYLGGCLLAGQTISLVTSDASTGGTLDYAGGFILTEFNA